MRINMAKGVQSVTSSRSVGHSYFCPNCRGFRVQAFTMVGNGIPKLSEKCHTCGSEEEYTFVAGGWIPKPVLETLDAFVKGRAEATLAALDKAVEDVFKDAQGVERELGLQPSTKPAGKVTSGLSLSGHKVSGLLKSKPRVSTRGRIALAVASVPLLVMGICGLLIYTMHVYIHPIYEWVAPYWQPWMNTPLLTILPLMAAGAMLAMARPVPKRAEKRETKEDIMTEIISEENVLGGMEEF